jgi:pimeloyl-ACP methyl ester carboxylesterase
MNAVVQQSHSDPTAIRPFRVNVPESELTDLRRRIAATRFPGKDPGGDPAPGLPLATLQKLAQYWATEYDWRKVEAKLNSYPNFITEIDGLDIHFIHARSKHESALPLIVTHGWPGSVVEQLRIIEPLIDPTAHGGKASDAFHVVMPSMAGYGFSGKPGTSGWDTTRMARAWAVLMKRLGYTRYVAQGGDWGAHVTEQMGVLAPPELLGIHINFASAVPPEILKGLQSGTTPCGLSAEESRAFERLAFFFTRGLSYAQQMATHPHALCGIVDSPVGLAAWLLDTDLWNYELIARAVDGQREGLTRDDILDDITLYWLTDTALSSARLYREHKLPFFARMGVEIPVAVSAFRDEIYQVPRNWAERAYPKLIHYNKVETGGHFAAWEQPALFTAELRAAFSSLRGTTRSANATYISGSCL